VDELFASVRNNVALVTLICSFLSIKDRVRLGHVDKQFYADKDRGQIVGVYGDSYLDIEAALDKVRKDLEYKSILGNLTDFEDNSPSWGWVQQVGSGEASWVAERLQHSWFDDKLGYDLEAIQEHADFGEVQEIVLLQRLAPVNTSHRKKIRKCSRCCPQM
jgi:hypothetical protein